MNDLDYTRKIKTTSERPSRQFFGLLSLSLLAVTFTFCRLRPIYWEDVWWHLGVGEHIVTHHRIPLVDVFSWTVRGARWVNTEWLYEVILYGGVRAIGLTGVIFLKTALMLAGLYFVDARLRLWKASVFERLLFLGLAFMAAWPFWVERADLSSLALLSALFFEIDRESLSPRQDHERRLLWIFLFTVWANVHGAFPIGLLVIGVRGIFQYSSRPTVARRTLMWALFCTGATFANPYGPGLLFGIFRGLGGKLDQVAEWLPPSGMGFLFFFCALALSALIFLSKRKWTWDDGYAAMIVLLFAGYALWHQRFVHFFAIGAFPYAAREWLKSPWRNRLSEHVSAWQKPALAVCSAILFTTSVASARLIQGGVNLAESGYVKEACDFIESQKIQGPFYNDYKFGSYWIWRFKGNPPVFQDGRHATVQGYDRVIETCLQAQKTPKTWNAYVDRMGIRAALVRNPAMSRRIIPPIFDRYFPKALWKLAYQDDLCLLFVRYNKAVHD